MPARILLVDDDDKLRRILTMRLESEGYAVTNAASGDQALAAIDEDKPDLVLADLRMPGIDGLALLQRVQFSYPGLPVIIMTAHGDIPDAVAATRSGAAEFLTKPIDRDDLLHTLRQHLPAGDKEDDDAAWSRDFLTRNPALRNLLHNAQRVARTDSSVLIVGPSGSGKEVLARCIHRASGRRSAPFVAINCGAVPSELLESELFGHRKGAFTGAASDHLGLFRSADGGTVFLDEIGDMPADLQVKLLRVLQDRQVRPVGDTRQVNVDVRVLSATHRDLPRRIQAGEFREDLYYRLNVVSFELPALNERREDIPLLVNTHLARLRERGFPQRVCSQDALEVLANAPWPGNIRQLFNVVEQAAALSTSRVIGADFLRGLLNADEEPIAVLPFDQARDNFTRRYLQRLLTMTQGNVSQAARLAGRNRTDLYKLLKRHNLEPSSFKDTPPD